MDDLFIAEQGEEGIGLLFEDGLLESGAASAVIGASYPSLAHKKKKLEFVEPPWRQFKALDLAREHQKQERERQTHIAAIRDQNLQKAQAALQERRQREERINRERLKNLEKARKAKQQ